MSREVEDPTVDEKGYDVHPAFGLIGASRGSGGPGVLFDSDILHQHTIRIRIHGAVRKRDLNHDWIGSSGRAPIVELELSEAQWASFVSTMNVGDGVPATIRFVDGDYVPELPFEPRLALAMEETQEAAQETFGKIQRAMAAYEKTIADKAPASVRRKARHDLHYAIENAVPNVKFVGKQLTRHAEDVVTRARADIEAFVVTKARQIGIDVEELGGTHLFELEEGDGGS